VPRQTRTDRMFTGIARKHDAPFNHKWSLAGRFSETLQVNWQRRLSCALLLVSLCSGCASVSHSRIPYKPIPDDPNLATVAIKENETADRQADGIRYYEASPYLLVYSDGKGGIVWKIYYLPDQTRKMIAEPFNIVAKVTTNMQFSNGVLTESTVELDQTAVPKALISAAEKMVPLAFADQPPHQVPAPQLYKIILNGDQVYFAGGSGNRNVNVNAN
jgi:hypothetical protein